MEISRPSCQITPTAWMESATCCGMELARSDAWNQSEGERALIRASRDAMRDFVAIPYNARARWLHTNPSDCIPILRIAYQSFGLDKKRTKRSLRPFFGWGTRIRTEEMTESESVALPLGDAPLLLTGDIIAHSFAFVKGFLKKSLKFFSIFFESPILLGRGHREIRTGRPVRGRPEKDS